jgi:hypothetical protein
MKTYVGVEHSSTFLVLDNRWRWEVSFKLLSLYPREKSRRYPLGRRLGGPPSQSGQHYYSVLYYDNNNNYKTFKTGET